MKTNIKVTAIGLSGVLLLGGLIAQMEVPKTQAAIVKPQELLEPEIIEHYGVMVPKDPKGLELAEVLHRLCNTREAWYSPEPSSECKARLIKELGD